MTLHYHELLTLSGAERFTEQWEGQAVPNGMEVNGNESCILHLRQDCPGYIMYRVGDERPDSSLTEELWERWH